VDGLKSVALAIGVMLFFLIVLDGKFVRRQWGGAPAIGFCHRFEDVWLLESVPCFFLNFGVIVATMLGIILVYGAFAAVVRR
jgi:hypothetical protein